MPWLTIIIALLTYFLQKRSGASDAQALTAAALTGAGTYYVSHNTEWGNEHLGAFDGVVPGAVGTSATTGSGSTTAIIPTTTGSDGSGASGLSGLVTKYGTSVAAGVAGATLAGSSSFLWLAVGAAALLLLRN